MKVTSDLMILFSLLELEGKVDRTSAICGWFIMLAAFLEVGDVSLRWTVKLVPHISFNVFNFARHFIIFSLIASTIRIKHLVKRTIAFYLASLAPLASCESYSLLLLYFSPLKGYGVSNPLFTVAFILLFPPAGLASVGDHTGWKWEWAGSDCFSSKVMRKNSALEDAVQLYSATAQ